MRRRTLVLAGLVLAFVGTVLALLVYPAVGASWVLLVGICLGVGGVVTVGQVALPHRSSFRAGTQVWQNDGLPGGGAG